MPSAAEIERLRALVARLTPLSTKQRGELIAADDWNLLVGALIEVGRATLGTGAAETVAPHEHADQVGIGWLDPRVRQLVTGGGVKDPAVETEFIKLRRDLSGLTSRIDRVGTDLDHSRARLDQIATNDLTREALLTSLNRKVLGAADDRGDIADLRSTLRTLQTEVGRAVQVGTQLEVDGQPVDIPALVQRVSAVETLRDRLTQPSGELLDASALEVRLLELQTSLVTQGQLTEAIGEVREDATAGGLDMEAVLDAARLAGHESATAATEVLAHDLRAEVNSRLEGIEPVVTAEVGRATESLRDEVLNAARAETLAAVDGARDAVREQLTALVEERLAVTTDQLDQRLAGVTDLVQVKVDRQVESRLSGELVDLNGRIDELQGAVVRLDEQVRVSTSAIEDLDLRLVTARREEDAARARLRVEMLERVDAVEGQIDPRINAAIDGARAILRTDLEATVAAARRDLEVRLAQVAREAAATEVQVLSTSIRTDVQSLIRQEIDVSLAEMRTQISGELTALQTRVAGMVSTEVARATADIPRLVNAEFESFKPELIRSSTTTISTTPVLRPPIG